jgi:hypothetical protein
MRRVAATTQKFFVDNLRLPDFSQNNRSANQFHATILFLQEYLLK